MAGWKVELNGVTLSGGSDPGHGTLTTPPDGMGAPALRTEDVTYPQRDGVRHFSDWYSPRIITLTDVTVCNDGCPGCPTARRKVHEIVNAWSRQCDDTELVIWTDCPPDADDEERAFTGPYGVVGRPRAAEVRWERSNIGCASLLLRFDAVDHRLFVLEDDGEPGSGARCVELHPSSEGHCRTYPRCYDPEWCFDVTSGSGGGLQDVTVTGSLCASPTITLYPSLTDPVIENTTTGETIGYRGTIPAGADPVVIDTETGTATQGGASRTHLLTGDTRFTMDPGLSVLRMISFSSDDTGWAELCWRPAVVMG